MEDDADRPDAREKHIAIAAALGLAFMLGAAILGGIPGLAATVIGSAFLGKAICTAASSGTADACPPCCWQEPESPGSEPPPALATGHWQERAGAMKTASRQRCR